MNMNIPLPESQVVERSEPGKCPGVETPCFRRAFARLLFTWDSRIVFENFKANESTAKASVSSPGNIPGEVSPTSLTRENPGSLEATGYMMIEATTAFAATTKTNGKKSGESFADFIKNDAFLPTSSEAVVVH